MAVGAPATLPDPPPIAGFRLASTACGIKKNGRVDLLLVEMTPGTTVAGVFTRNQVVAAPVTLCRERLPAGEARALLVNSGNANACTGTPGMAAAQRSCAAAAAALNAPQESIFVSSTGVIGEPLPDERIVQALPKLAQQLHPGHWLEAAQAIMTTDTFPKIAQRHCQVAGQTVQVVGIAKGAGMIHPNMATMLGYLFTDAAVAPQPLQAMLSAAVEESFNSISVDGDTSTNDTLMLFASGQAGHPPITDANTPEAAPLAQAVREVCQELAWWIVRDGEGATKFVTITVTGAANTQEAHLAAMTVAGSPLVKTALFGNDPNWGRIVAAVGRSGVRMDPTALVVDLGEARIVENGGRAPSYTEAAGQAVMQRPEIAIRIHLGAGTAEHTVWTCDFSHEYVTINADYRT